MLNNQRLFVFMLRFVAVVQWLLGIGFLVAPAGLAGMFGLAPAPTWTAWLFAMMAARFLGFGYGMWWAARDPVRHVHWINAMLVIQAIDWLATLYYLAAGAVTLGQVTTAAFLPAVFIAVLLSNHPWRARPVDVG
jgi:hypothetical protein